MTEKRFYYNVFYHAEDMSRVLEYEIIDRQSYPNYPNHDEKEDIPDWVIYIGENDSGWQDMLVDLLNKLHEEIQKCKEYNGILYANHTKTDRGLVKQISELKKENEQLKSDKEHLMGCLIRFFGYDDEDIDYNLNRESNREYGKQYYSMKEETKKELEE